MIRFSVSIVQLARTQFPFLINTPFAGRPLRFAEHDAAWILYLAASHRRPLVEMYDICTFVYQLKGLRMEPNRCPTQGI